MNLDELKERYYKISEKASDIARQLAFAGIALIWTFKTESANGSYILDLELLWSGAFIVGALGCDLLQYVSGTLIYGWFRDYKARMGVKPKVSLSWPRYFNWPAIGFFWTKIVLVVAAYIMLLGFIGNRLAGIASVAA